MSWEPSPGLASWLQAAVLAPSGDNTQPWRLRIDPQRENRVEVCVDPTRDLSPMNAGQRMARVAVGAAVENLVQAAEAWGRRAVVIPSGTAALAVELVDERGRPQRLETLGPSKTLPEWITSRVTNRRWYDGRPLDPGLAESLAGAVDGGAAGGVVWVFRREEVRRLARLVGEADGLLFGLGTARQAFFEKIRFDCDAGAAVPEGLSLGSLEVGAGERLGMELVRWLPDRVFRTLGLRWMFARRAEKLVCSASGLCVILARGWEVATDFEVGRLMQRAWLALSQRGLAVQPMMSLPVLQSMVREGVLGSAPYVAKRVQELAGAFGEGVGGASAKRVAAIVRFGFAERPTGRVGRRALADVVDVERASAAERTGLARAGVGEG